MQPVWVSIGIGILSIVFAAGTAWGVVAIRIKQIEKDQANLKSAIEALTASIEEGNRVLSTTIRKEFDRAVSRINKLMFQESGITRYQPREECGRRHDECRQDLIDRIKNLETKMEAPR